MSPATPKTSPSTDELIETWQNEEAPLLPLLHAFHERDGHISEEAVLAISHGLRVVGQ